MLVLLASAALLPFNFAPVRRTASLASSALLPLNTAPVRSTTSCGPLVLGRRGLISNAAAVFSAIVPSPAFAVKTAPVVDLTAELLFILRVQEACSQETRLIKTGKYRELQRLDIKRAVGMMLENYDLRSRFNRASSAAPREQVRATPLTTLTPAAHHSSSGKRPDQNNTTRTGLKQRRAARILSLVRR